MRSFLLSILLLFIISSGSVVTIFSSVSAPELVEDSWNPKTPMSQARAGLGVVAVDGKIYAIGGITDDVEGCVGVNECYDPVTDSWVTLASMPTSRFGFAIVEYQGKIYCIGGVTGKSGMYSNLGINEVYDIATDSWSTKASMPRSGMYLHASIIDGKFFVIYGFDLFMYDPVKDSWTAKACMPDLCMPTSVFGTVVLDNKLIAIDAYRFEADVEQKIMIYDPITDVWSEGFVSPPNVINTRFYGGAVLTTGQYAPQKIYTIHLAGNNAYDPIHHTWVAIEPMPTTRSNFGVAVIDDILYVIGGYVSSDLGDWYTPVTHISTNEQYVPIGYNGTLPHNTSPSTAITPSGSFVSSEPESSGPFLNSLILAVVLVLVVGIVVGGYFSIFKKKAVKGNK